MPGLVDMAQPAFAEVGKKSTLRQAFWYRRTFTLDGPVPAVAMLKIHKARTARRSFSTARLVGEHLPCFTPALLDVKPYLKGDGQANELVIRVGADRESLPAGMPTGWDFEKYLLHPGHLRFGRADPHRHAVHRQRADRARRAGQGRARGGGDRRPATSRASSPPTCEVCEAASGKAVGVGEGTAIAPGGRPADEGRRDASRSPTAASGRPRIRSSTS